jgi:mannose-6-phosphate isomerase-like protein (cupin superfamily)
MSAMDIIRIAALASTPGGTARFEGADHGSSVSFFVVRSATGQGATKHRHPYDETFVILEAEIEVVVDDVLWMLQPGSITVIPAGSWHAFTNRSPHRALMVNIHASPRIIQEDWPA